MRKSNYHCPVMDRLLSMFAGDQLQQTTGYKVSEMMDR